MNIKEFHEDLKSIHKKYDEVVLKKITIEREFVKVKSDFVQRIMDCNMKTKEFTLEKVQLCSDYDSQKRSPAEVKKLRSQFARKRDKLMGSKNKKCHYCPQTEELTAHHLISIADGGENTEDNLVWACRKCHDAEEGR
jgi:hypothetical protein